MLLVLLLKALVKGTGESVPALLGGHVEMLFSALPSLSGAAGTNRVKLLASNGVGRSAQAPDLPALSEIIPGFNFASIVGIYARAGSPHTSGTSLNAAVGTAGISSIAATLAGVMPRLSQ